MLLVPCDGSSCSQRAFSIALDMAKVFDAEIILFSVIWIPPSPYKFFMFREGKEDTIVMLSDLGKATFSQHQNLKTKGEKHGIRLHSIIEQDSSPTNAILRCAKQHEADMIIIGSSAKKGWEKLYLGSVTEKVLQNAKIPVLIVK